MLRAKGARLVRSHARGLPGGEGGASLAAEKRSARAIGRAPPFRSPWPGKTIWETGRAKGSKRREQTGSVKIQGGRRGGDGTSGRCIVPRESSSRFGRRAMRLRRARHARENKFSDRERRSGRVSVGARDEAVRDQQFEGHRPLRERDRGHRR